jgi:hypothetical protein
VIWKIVKKVARAAIAQPWDYQGQGAPNDWEMRVSPQETHVAVHDPQRGQWMILDVRTWEPVAEETNQRVMDNHTEDWRQFLSVEDPDD